ncbi:hypothetical protein BQ9231_00044 [Cedratvirus lausannensis]|uniref:Uncharacterized protein n=2 Tax=Pithoviruses TaxID=2023203 RepID=A0A285PXH0_9VIRU|nr:hypothetical protein BQ9231_00044 [Cedratvirus lausannensis]SPN79890.1 Hypothetical protein ZAZAV_579 [Cedratvirus Zaza IHUMI]
MFALPSLGGKVAGASITPSPSSLTVESVIDVQVVPSHKKTFTLSSSPQVERDRVEIPIVSAPRLSPLAKNVPAPTRGTRGTRGSTRSPRMKRIDREAYIAALKSLPPLPKMQNEPQGLSLALPQIPQVPVMLPNVASSTFEDIPQEVEEDISEPEEEPEEPETFNWGSEPEDEDEEEY